MISPLNIDTNLLRTKNIDIDSSFTLPKYKIYIKHLNFII